MYHGEVSINYEQITNFLRTARLLQVRGLTGETSEPIPTTGERKPKESPTKEKEEKKPALERPPSADSEERNFTVSPVPKRQKISNSVGSYSGSFSANHRESPASPIQRREDSTPPNVSPPSINSLPSGIPPLPPIPGLSMPLSMPSTITSLPPVTSSLPPGNPSHCPPSIPSSSPFPHLFAPHYGQQQSQGDDASDTCASDRSEERPRGDLDGDDDQDNSLEKMSGLANMAALKG